MKCRLAKERLNNVELVFIASHYFNFVLFENLGAISKFRFLSLYYLVNS